MDSGRRILAAKIDKFIKVTLSDIILVLVSEGVKGGTVVVAVVW